MRDSRELGLGIGVVFCALLAWFVVTNVVVPWMPGLPVVKQKIVTVWAPASYEVVEKLTDRESGEVVRAAVTLPDFERLSPVLQRQRVAVLEWSSSELLATRARVEYEGSETIAGLTRVYTATDVVEGRIGDRLVKGVAGEGLVVVEFERGKMETLRSLFFLLVIIGPIGFASWLVLMALVPG